MKKIIMIVLILLGLVVLLMGCSSGGSSDNSSQTTLNITSPVILSNKVVLTWGAVPGASSYLVQRAVISGSSNISGAGVTTENTSYTDFTVSPNTNYIYTVTALKSNVALEKNTIKISTPGTPLLNIQIEELTDTSCKINYQSVSGASVYEIYLDGVLKGSETGETFVFNDLLKNSTHTVEIMVKNQDNFVLCDDFKTFKTLDNISLNAVACYNQVILNWSTTSGASTYQIFKNNVLLGSQGTLNYTDSSDIVPGDFYQYKIVALNSQNQELNEGTSEGNIPHLQAVSTSFVSQTEIDLSWTSNLENVVKYNVLNGSNVVASGISSNAYTIQGLPVADSSQVGNYYDVTVQYLDKDNNVISIGDLKNIETVPAMQAFMMSSVDHSTNSVIIPKLQDKWGVVKYLCNGTVAPPVGIGDYELSIGTLTSAVVEALDSNDRILASEVVTPDSEVSR